MSESFTITWHRCEDNALSYSSLTGTAMAFNKQVRYSFIWITETLAGGQPLSQVSSMTFRSIFSIDPISVALKRNHGQFFKWDEQYILTAEISLHIFWDAKSIQKTPKGQWVLIPWLMFDLVAAECDGPTRAGRYGQNNYYNNYFFIQVDIDNYHDKCHFYFIYFKF